MYDLSDEALCDRWIENPYFQFFCGEEFFQHRLPFDRSSLTRWFPLHNSQWMIRRQSASRRKSVRRVTASLPKSGAMRPTRDGADTVVRRNASRMAANGEGERLPVVVLHDEAGIPLVNLPGRREAAGRHYAQSSSSSRRTAGAFGFLTLRQCADRPAR
jgi:hypothetical protein